MYTPKILRQILLSQIRALGKAPERFAGHPGRDFTRPRILTFETLILLLLTMSEKSIGKGLAKHFCRKTDTPSASAFVQQRQKLHPAALESLFRSFTALLRPSKTFRGFRLLAVDGSSLKSAAYPQDPASYRPGTEHQRGWNLFHINALFDLENCIYHDALVQKEHEKNESRALCQMVDRTSLPGPVLLLADRNYEAYNNLAHLEEKGWKYVIRIKDKGRTTVSGVKLPEQAEFDLPIPLTLGRVTKRQLEARGIPTPEPYYRLQNGVTFDRLEPEGDGFYRLSFRVVRLKVTEGNMVTLLTNLDPEQFPPAALCKLYARRWGIETSFRDLKYTVGMVHLHAKKPDFVMQEIFSAFILYNFAQAVTWAVDTDRGRSKYKRHVNFSDAVERCCAFLHKPTGDLCALLARSLVPYRPGRSFPRPMTTGNHISALYVSAR